MYNTHLFYKIYSLIKLFYQFIVARLFHTIIHFKLLRKLLCIINITSIANIIFIINIILITNTSIISYTNKSQIKITTKEAKQLLEIYGLHQRIDTKYTCTHKPESIKSGLINSTIGIDAKNQSQKYLILQGFLPDIIDGCKSQIENANSPITFYYLDKEKLGDFEQDIIKQIEKLNIEELKKMDLNTNSEILKNYDKSPANRLLALNLIQPKFDIIYKKHQLFPEQIFKIPGTNRKIKHHIFQDKVCIAMKYHWALQGLEFGNNVFSNRTELMSDVISNGSISDDLIDKFRDNGWGYFSCKYLKDPHKIENNNTFEQIRKNNSAVVGFTYPVYMFIYNSISNLLINNKSILFIILKYMQSIIILCILIKSYLLTIDILLGRMDKTTIITQVGTLFIILITFLTTGENSILTDQIIPTILQIPIALSSIFTIPNTMCSHEGMHIFESLDCFIGKALGLESLILFNDINNESAIVLLSIGLTTALIPTPFTLLTSIILLSFPIGTILLPSYITYVLVTDLLGLGILLVTSPIWGTFFIFDYTKSWAQASFRLTIGYILKPILFILPITLSLVLVSEIFAPQCTFQSYSIIHNESSKILSLVDYKNANSTCKNSIFAQQDAKLHTLLAAEKLPNISSHHSFQNSLNTQQANKPKNNIEYIFHYLIYSSGIWILLIVLPRFNNILINITGTASISLPQINNINSSQKQQSSQEKPNEKPKKFNDKTTDKNKKFNDKTTDKTSKFNDKSTVGKFNDKAASAQSDSANNSNTTKRFSPKFN